MVKLAAQQSPIHVHVASRGLAGAAAFVPAAKSVHVHPQCRCIVLPPCPTHASPCTFLLLRSVCRLSPVLGWPPWRGGREV